MGKVIALAAGGMLSPPQPIQATHDLSGFECGTDVLDLWLRQRALKNEGPGSRTYVVLKGDVVVGYYCLAMGSVARSVAPNSMRRNMPDPLPVMVMGRLAVHRTCAKIGIGSGLLKDALIRTATVSSAVGTSGLMVNAKDEKAADFYLKFGFLPSPSEPLTLMMPLKDIMKAFHDAGVAAPE